MIFQLCYASTSTSEKTHLPLDLREVLSEAHHFNYVNNILILAKIMDSTSL